MMRRTTWRPDTCECEVEYEWDDALAPDVRTHTVVQVNKACDAHQGLSVAHHHATLFDENPRKNRTLADVAERLGLADVRDLDGVVAWSFDAARVLRVRRMDGKPWGAVKAAAQSHADTTHGAGKVTFE